MQLDNITARKILNSRKEETIAVIAETKGKKVEASAPSGKSKGKHEVQDFSSRGIDFSISFLNVLGKKIVSEKVSFETFNDLEKIENLVKKYDKTPNIEFIGGNTLYVLEAAILKAIAISQEQRVWQFLTGSKKPILPRPLGNCVGGSLHVKQKEKTDFQEFLLLPKTKHFFDAYFINLQAYKEVKALILEKDKEWKGTLTDESALATTLDNETVLALLQELKEKIKGKFDIEIDLGLDMAASSLWKASKYHYKNFSPKIKAKNLTKQEQIYYIEKLAKNNNLFYLEDPLQEEDFEGFAKLHSKLPGSLVVGDDLTCTNFRIVEKALKSKAINGLIVKPNQIGSLIETKKVIDLAKKYNIVTIISHRSGETSDNIISHLAVGWQIPIIKTGILGKERFAKLNELLRIEREIRT